MKHILTLITAAVMVFTLTACGGGDAADTQTDAGNPSTTPASEPSSEPTPEPEPEEVEVPVYEVVESKIYKSTYTYSDFVLDENGRVLEKKVSGSERGTYTYEYDEEGRVTAENYTSSSGSYDNYTYTYNEFGQIATSSESSSGVRDGNEFVYEYEYDEQNRPIQMTWVNTASDHYSMLYTYEYDENGNVAVETQTTYADGLDGAAGNSYEIHHTYDEDGRLIKSVSQKAGESSTSTSTYTYDCVGSYTVSP